MEGTPFGRYRLVQLLGRGGMGEVWRAFDTETNRVVAVKVLATNLGNDPQFEQRFRREALAAAGLNDPHVVPIHNFGEIHGRLYVDMRLIEGRDLAQIIADGPMHPARAVAIIDNVASALNAAHRIGLVHRDVKPSNILVGERDFAYLIDFGIARTATDTGLTNTGAVVGTWAYLAPERITGQSDHRADVYALTCVLHECLTGQRPYPGDSIEQQVGGHLGLPPPRPSAIRNTVPTPFDEVVATGMAKNPQHRYPSTLDLAYAARTAATQPNWYAPPPGNHPPPGGISPSAFTEVRQPPIPTKRSPMRAAIIVPAVLAVVLLVAGAIFAFTRVGGGSSGPSSTAVAQPPSSARPTGPTFEGTFTTSYGPPNKFTGGSAGPVVAPATWVVRSTCNQSGCVAAASTVNRPEGVLSRIFDLVDGRWVSVSEEPGRDACANADAQRWERTTLEPRPDGSMVGDFSSLYDLAVSGVAALALDCSSRSAVTYTRTGDADPDVETADLATLAARVVSPGRGLRGRYHSLSKVEGSGETVSDDNYGADTICLRTGDRCLSYLNNDKNGHILLFAGGQWTESQSNNDTCANGAPARAEIMSVFLPPQPPQDPIQLLSANPDAKVTGGCPGTARLVWTLTRIGD